MKELSIEEKAKAYDKALEAVKSLQEVNPSDEGIQNWVNENFPELKESEDEKIRETLIENFKWFCGDYPETTKWGKDDNLLVKDIIAWLEKQSKLNPYSGVSFEYNGHTWGMCARDNGVDILLDSQLLRHLEKQGETFTNEDVDNAYISDTKKFLDNIQIGDRVTRNEDGVLVNLSQLKRVAKKDEKQGEQKPQGKTALEAIKEEKIDNANKVEQKSAWSEEDETNLRRTEYAVMKFFGGDCSLVGWLRKSLKERCTWKPSDEQIKAVKEVACYSSVFSEKTIDNLISLSKDLKKLREE